MKKILAIMLVFASLFAFAACGKKEPAETPAETSAVKTNPATEAATQTTKISAVAGKTIILKSVASENYVEIKTNADGIATVMKIHKFFADAEAFSAAESAGSYGKYTLEATNKANFEIIYSDSETVKGMAYDVILAKAEATKDYIVIPA